MRKIISLLLLLVSLVEAFSPLNNPTSLSNSRLTTFRLNDQQRKTLVVERDGQSFDLDYRTFGKQTKKAPVVVLHGGPGLSSRYLFPLKREVQDRQLLYYDQLGCGRSSEPQDINMYSIDKAVDDLIQLLDTVRYPKFHILGHSYGGILGFEYLKKAKPSNCLSITLSNSPTNAADCMAEYDRLYAEVDKRVPEFLVANTFERSYVCRAPDKPKALTDAEFFSGKVWAGMPVISDYVAQVDDAQKLTKPPALLIRGAYDFVTESNLAKWKDLFETTETVEYPEGAHHPLLEDEIQYAETLQEFWAKHE